MTTAGEVINFFSVFSLMDFSFINSHTECIHVFQRSGFGVKPERRGWGF